MNKINPTYPTSYFIIPSYKAEKKPTHRSKKAKPLRRKKSRNPLALHKAIRTGNVALATQLLKEGMKPTKKDSQGFTVYDYALFSENPAILKTLFPKEAVKILQKSLGKTGQIFKKIDEEKTEQAFDVLKKKLEGFLHATKKSFRNAHGAYRLLLDKDYKTIQQFNIDFSSKAPCPKTGLTLLQCALYDATEKDNSMIDLVLKNVPDKALLAKNKHGFSALDLAVIFGLSTSVEKILKRLGKTFDIHTIDPKWGTLAHLAIVSNQPHIVSILCTHDFDMNHQAIECSAADLLVYKAKKEDPLHINTAQYILAAFNIASLVTDQFSANATLALMLCSILANYSLLNEKGLRSQFLFWGGEAFSYITRLGLVQVPLLKAVVDIWRIKKVVTSSLKAIKRSFKNIHYETRKAFWHGAVHAAIAGSSIYHIRDSISLLFKRSFRTMNYFIEAEEIENILKKSRYHVEKKITFGNTYLKGNPIRDELSELVDANQKEYSDRWGLTHRSVTENLVKDQCKTVARNPIYTQCSPHWNKIKVLKDWLETPQTQSTNEEWYILADDDMVIGNMKINPYKAIDQLRNKDQSIIVAQDTINYSGNPLSSVNTGVLFVRKDSASQEIINKIWEKRNQVVPDGPSYCPTLGICSKQFRLHEQQALAELIESNRRSILDKVAIVKQRDFSSKKRKHIALNTFNRAGSFLRKTPGWEQEKCIHYKEDMYHPDGKWRQGDWMGQPSGVPIKGWNCNPKTGIPDTNTSPKQLRKERIEEMLSQVIR